MRITGTLTTTGTFHICENYPQEFHDDLHIESTAGIFITADDETLRAASNLPCATVDIYPHPVNGLVAGECTPENYAHALARLAHAEDHLAREVRSSQALTMLHTNMCAIADRAATEANDLRVEVKRLRRVLHKHDISADTSGEECDDGARDAAWSEYLVLRKQIRKVAAEGRTDSEEQRTLVARALDIARLHNFDSPTRALEEAQARIDLAVDVLATAYYTDGAHHKQWVADQALRALLGDRYDAWADERVDGGALASELTGTAP